MYSSVNIHWMWTPCAHYQPWLRKQNPGNVGIISKSLLLIYRQKKKKKMGGKEGRGGGAPRPQRRQLTPGRAGGLGSLSTTDRGHLPAATSQPRGPLLERSNHLRPQPALSWWAAPSGSSNPNSRQRIYVTSWGLPFSFKSISNWSGVSWAVVLSLAQTFYPLEFPSGLVG